MRSMYGERLGGSLASSSDACWAWFEGLGRRDVRHVTAKRARNLLTPLRSVFEDAVNDERIDSNPFDRIALNKLLKQTTKSSDHEADPFTAAERALLLEHARADEAPMLRFWFNSGLRPGELMALRWNRIDWAARTTRIDVNLVGGKEKGPKTAAGVRDVELNDEAIAALIAQKTITFGAGRRCALPEPVPGAPHLRQHAADRRRVALVRGGKEEPTLRVVAGKDA
jgi:integrase